jgi:phage host-nuclease inhibitor protein Gam
MKGTLGTTAAVAVATLAVATLAHGEEQTRESYKTQLEPLCQANRMANKRIMAGARQRVNRDELEAAGKQFVRVSRSFGGLVKQIAAVPPPSADGHRVERWLELMRLLETRLRLVGKYFKAGEKIKATHESILAERSGLSANNISIVFHFHYCRLSHFD